MLCARFKSMSEPKEKPQPKTVEQIYEAALKLSAEERDKLYFMLLKDGEQYAQPQIDPEIERAALEECERRVQLVREGKMELIDADEVIREARKILDQPSE
jgi:hypothetical protein